MREKKHGFSIGEDLFWSEGSNTHIFQFDALPKAALYIVLVQRQDITFYASH